MSNGWAFALGWIGCSVFIAWGMNGPSGVIKRAASQVATGYLRGRGWKIAGVRYRARPHTRALMEEVIALQTHAIDVPPFAMLLSTGAAPDDDEFRQRQLRLNAERTDSMFASARALLVDKDGNQPPQEAMDEMTVEEVNKIVQVCM